MKHIKKGLRKLGLFYGFISTLPFRFHKREINSPENLAHSEWVDYLSENFNKEGMRVLELGSRNVTGANLRSKFSKATYVGFDFYEGENVDIV